MLKRKRKRSNFRLPSNSNRRHWHEKMYKFVNYDMYSRRASLVDVQSMRGIMTSVGIENCGMLVRPMIAVTRGAKARNYTGNCLSPVWPEVQQDVSLIFRCIFLLHPSIRDLRIRSISSPVCLRVSGVTSGKYRSIALTNRCRYNFGVTTVGSPLPAPPRNPVSLTQVSNFLSKV